MVKVDTIPSVSNTAETWDNTALSVIFTAISFCMPLQGFQVVRVSVPLQSQDGWRNRLCFKGLTWGRCLVCWVDSHHTLFELLNYFIKWKLLLDNFTRNSLYIWIACSALWTDLTKSSIWKFRIVSLILCGDSGALYLATCCKIFLAQIGKLFAPKICVSFSYTLTSSFGLSLHRNRKTLQSSGGTFTCRTMATMLAVMATFCSSNLNINPIRFCM